MCPHENHEVIEEGITEEEWQEGDIFTQSVYDWVVCRDCGDDFACKVA